MSKMDIDAKKDVLKELMQMAMEELRGKNKHGMDEVMKMKKVSVMAPSKEGIEQGLDKAKDVVADMPMGDESSDESSEDDMYADEDCPPGEESVMSDEEKKLMLQKLMKKA